MHDKYITTRAIRQWVVPTRAEMPTGRKLKGGAMGRQRHRLRYKLGGYDGPLGLGHIKPAIGDAIMMGMKWPMTLLTTWTISHSNVCAEPGSWGLGPCLRGAGGGRSGVTEASPQRHRNRGRQHHDPDGPRHRQWTSDASDPGGAGGVMIAPGTQLILGSDKRCSISRERSANLPITPVLPLCPFLCPRQPILRALYAFVAVPFRPPKLEKMLFFQ